jgi:hypothetical protein
MARLSSLVCSAAFLVSSLASAAPLPPDQAQYAPYRFLVGSWDVSPQSGGAPIASLLFRWGPNKSYLWYAQSLILNGKEVPHFEGVLTWNGVHKNLDMLLTVDLQFGLAEESGTVSVEPDGTIVREITSTFSEGTRPIGEPPVGPGGKSEHFRQTYKLISPGKVETTVMHETASGWIPTFPGSDHLVMTLRDG